MTSLENAAARLPIRSGHTYTGIAGYDSARLQLGDNYFIDQSGFNICTLLPFIFRDLPDLYP